MPNFDRHGYDKHLDLTEEEYYAQVWYDEPDVEPEHFCHAEARGEDCFGADENCKPEPFEVVAEFVYIEGEPYEDTYLPGIPDYDLFNRPSWEA